MSIERGASSGNPITNQLQSNYNTEQVLKFPLADVTIMKSNVCKGEFFMKKYAGILISAAVLWGMCGCDTNSQNSAEADLTGSETVLSVSESSETSADVPETTETTLETAETEADEQLAFTITAEEIEYEEQRVRAFAEFLESGGEKEFTYYEQGYRIDVYDFMKGFRADKCSYTKREDGNYDLVITCSESANEMFPEGDSYWIFGEGLFYPAEESRIIYLYEGDYSESLKTAYGAAWTFSLYTDVYEADGTWFDTYKHMSPHDFFHYNPYMETDENDGSVAIEEHIRATKQLYNLNIPESAFDGVLMNEDGKVFPNCAHGGTWNYTSLKAYEETDSELKVTVDFYGDELYFYPVIESEYTFSKNEDGTITLQRVEKLFDRGYAPAAGCV